MSKVELPHDTVTQLRAAWQSGQLDSVRLAGNRPVPESVRDAIADGQVTPAEVTSLARDVESASVQRLTAAFVPGDRPREARLTVEQANARLRSTNPELLARDSVGDVTPDGRLLNSWGTMLLGRWDRATDRMTPAPTTIDGLGPVDNLWANGLAVTRNGVAMIDPTTMQPTWRMPNPTPDTRWDNRGFFTGRDLYGRVDLQTGQPLWVMNPSSSGLPDGDVQPSFDNPSILQYGSRSTPRVLARVDRETGDVRWRLNVPAELGSFNDNSPSHRDGIYQFQNGLARVDLETGRLLWSRPDLRRELAVPQGGDLTYRDGLVAARNRDSTRVARLDLETGRTLWTRDNELGLTPDMSLPVVQGSDGTRFVGGPSASGPSVGMLDPGTGALTFQTADLDAMRGRFERLGITRLDRFYGREFAIQVAENRERMERNDPTLFQRPVSVVLAARRDENGAFQHNNFDALARNSNTLYFEVDNDQSFYAAMDLVRQRVQEHGGTIRDVVFAGHATRSHLSWGERDPARGGALDPERTMDAADRGRLATYAQIFRGTNMWIYGCEAGEGDGGRDNMVNLLAETAGRYARRVTAPTVASNVYFTTDAGGDVSSMRVFDNLGFERRGALYARPGILFRP